MTQQKIFVVIALCATLGLIGCQASDSTSANSDMRDLNAALEDMEVRIGEEQRSISNFTLNGFRAINETSLVITSGVNDRYLLNLTSPCFGLPYATGVRIESRTNNIMTFDNVVVEDLSGQPELCQISKIYALEDVAASGAVVR